MLRHAGSQTHVEHATCSASILTTLSVTLAGCGVPVVPDSYLQTFMLDIRIVPSATLRRAVVRAAAAVGASLAGHVRDESLRERFYSRSLRVQSLLSR